MRKRIDLKDDVRLGEVWTLFQTDGSANVPLLLVAIFVAAISIEIFAEIAESLKIISRPFEGVLNFVALLIWGGVGLLVAFRIRDNPWLRWTLVLGASLFVTSQCLNIGEDLLRALGTPLGPSQTLAVNLCEKTLRVLGWGLFFTGLYLLVLELDRSRALLTRETEELRREVTRRRRIEDDLRSKEDVYRQAIAQAEAVPYQRDYRSNTYTFLDEGVRKLTGYAPNELTPSMWENEIVQETVLGSDHEHLPMEQVLIDIREGRINHWRDDCRIRTKDGETRWCTDASIQILGEDGLPVGSIGILQDITEKKRAEKELEQRIEFERLVTTLSAEFIQAGNDEIDDRIQSALQAIGEFAEVDRCFLFRFDHASGAVALTHEWTGEGVSSIRDRWGVVPFTDYPWIYDRLSRGEIVQHSTMRRLPSEAVKENEAIQGMEVGSFVFVPQVSGGKTIGFVGFDSHDKGRSWPPHTLSLLQVVGRIFAYAQERMATEEAILSGKERYRLLFENSHDAIYMTDAEGRFVDVNPAFLKLFEIGREELPDLTLSSLFTSPEGGKRFQSVLDREGWVRDYEVALTKKGRGRMDALLTASFRTDADGNVQGCQGIIRDMTEKKKADKSFRLLVEGTSGATGEAFFASLVRALAGVMGVRYALVSELVGRDPSQLRSLAFWSGNRLAEPFAVDIEGSPFEEVVRTGFVHIPRGASQALPSPNIFTELEVQCHLGIRLADSNGNPIGLLSVFDGAGLQIDFRTAESLLRIFAARASAELSRIRAEETRRDLERQVFESQKIESLGVLAGGIAHDFNNLLTSILGNVCLAQYDLEPDSPLQGYLQNVERATQRAADLAHQMLAYSGKSKFVVEELQVNEILQEVEDILSAALPKNVEFKKKFAVALPAIDGDATQLRQVFMNLVINAGESMNNNGGVVRIRTRQIWLDDSYSTDIVNREELTPGAYLEIRVADNGSGMDEGTQARIFDPFFTTKFTGRGLGLAAVLGIVRSHNGGIGVESTPGQGTTFTLLLPVTSSGARKKGEQKERTSAVSQASGGILVVDDEEAVRTVAEKILVRAGYDVLVARDGLEGLLLLERNLDSVDLILLDLNMPNLSGEQTYRRIQSFAPGKRVVIMSGYSEQEALTLCEDFGLTGFLQKPFLPEVLLREVEVALSERDGSQTASQKIVRP